MKFLEVKFDTNHILANVLRSLGTSDAYSTTHEPRCSYSWVKTETRRCEQDIMKEGRGRVFSKRSLLPRPFHGRKMVRRALNRMIAITCTSHCVVSRRWHSFYLCVKRACCSLRSAGLYLQNVLPPFYPHAPHKARRSRANRPAASNDALRVLSVSMVVVLTVLFAECVFSLFLRSISILLKTNNRYVI